MGDGAHEGDLVEAVAGNSQNFRLEHGALHSVARRVEDEFYRLFLLPALEFGEKAEGAIVDAGERDPEKRGPPRRTEHGAVAAEHDEAVHFADLVRIEKSAHKNARLFKHRFKRAHPIFGDLIFVIVNTDPHRPSYIITFS